MASGDPRYQLRPRPYHAATRPSCSDHASLLGWPAHTVRILGWGQFGMMTEASATATVRRSATATVRRCFPGPRTPPARPCPMLIPPHHSPHHATAARPHNNLTALPLPRLSTHATPCLPPLPGYTVSGQGLTLPGAALQQRSARSRARAARGDAHYHDAGALATFLPVHHVGAARRGRGGAVAGAQTGGRGWAGVQLTCCLVPCRQPLAVERRGEGGDFITRISLTHSVLCTSQRWQRPRETRRSDAGRTG